ncbi:hypothetical protein GCM10023094_25680 [Rhodococcus olei]|uniref:Uncharacterized protein n=1 Tax=Rhodococcus olei TaxID=2161675 RepID=A0ABP8P2A6_9NOCA
MTRPAGADPTPDHTAARTWTWPRHLGRFRTSTVVMVLAFIATALLRGYFISEAELDEPQGEVVVPVQTTPAPAPQRTTPHPTSTTPTAPTPSTTAPASPPSGTVGTSGTPTTSPLIVLPPGLVPPGVELPPGVAVETTAPTATATPPTS